MSQDLGIVRLRGYFEREQFVWDNLGYLLVEDNIIGETALPVRTDKRA